MRPRHYLYEIASEHMTAKIIYTLTDEAPALATYSLLPIVNAFTGPAGVNVETSDISLAARILANFPEALAENQRVPDALAELGERVKQADANVIKLPNISASVPQLNAAIAELQSQGYAIPDYPAEPATDEERAIKAQYSKVLGSAVNPVLREGNSDRRVAAPVKAYARQNPHSMGAWSRDSASNVAHMDDGDFYGSETSAVIAEAGDLVIELATDAGENLVLKAKTPVLEGEVIDAAVMSCRRLREFFAREIESARDSGLLLSLHVKATMMKVSDPIIFGHAVEVYYAAVFAQHAALFAQLGVEPDNGIGDVHARLDQVDPAVRAGVEADIAA
jgi:isocitrate dehydrogenase